MSTGTQTEVVMPQMGVSVSEGTVTKWLKQVGEAIGRDEPLLEISTDKVDTEVPSPAEGVVAQILVQEGETVEVGTVLAVITPAGVAPAPVEPAATAPEPVPTPTEPVAAAPAPPAPTAAPAAEPAAAPAPVAPAATGNGKTFVSPVVARIAAEHGIDPSAVPGTGTGGRVTKKDIMTFIESGAAAAPPPAPSRRLLLPRLPLPLPSPSPQLRSQRLRPLPHHPSRRPWQQLLQNQPLHPHQRRPRHRRRSQLQSLSRQLRHRPKRRLSRRASRSSR